MYFSRVLMLQPYVASIYIPSSVGAQSSSEKREFFFLFRNFIEKRKTLSEISHQVFRAFAHCLWGRLRGCDAMSHAHLDLGIFCCSSLQILPSSVRLAEDHCQVSLEMFDWVHVRALAQQIKGIQSCPQDTPELSWPCVFLGSSLLWTRFSLCLCTTLREILVLQKKKKGSISFVFHWGETSDCCSTRSLLSGAQPELSPASWSLQIPKLLHSWLF